jgi:MAF protein
MNTQPFKLLLASSSPYRRELLSRLRIPFECASPHSDETLQTNETPEQYVARLASEKTQALRPHYPHHWIIGSDQACVLNGVAVSKPGNRETAIAQLKQASGNKIRFNTGLCLLNASTNESWSLVEPFDVCFRQLSSEQIEYYLDIEKPYDCAGSFKAEGLGIALFSALEGRDSNALIGLPLIGLVDLFQQAGIDILRSAAVQ